MLPTLLSTVLLLEECAQCYQLCSLQYCYWKDVLNVTNSSLYSIVIGRMCLMLPTLLSTVLLLEECA